MCRTVSDVAAILQVISGPDEQDPSSMTQPPIPDYLSVLNPNFIKGKRVGVLGGFHLEPSNRKGREAREAILTQSRLPAFEEALVHLRYLGAEVIGPVEIDTARTIWNQREKECRVLKTEFKVWYSTSLVASFSYFLWKIGINEYLSQLPEHRTGLYTLADIIHFNRTHPEMHFKGEEFQDM
jgi:amidase